ncbi:MAG: hypothetical protein IIZ92_03400 [Aquincola sp.]|nr:hypothetical protein [Aquincola sp.]
MAGGIDWFRWHHGTVNDQKFPLVARKSGASVAEVIAVWACLLERASCADVRGTLGEPDFEAMDCALGMADGKSAAIYEALQARALIDSDARVTAWSKRQPKRENDGAAERKRAQREREAAERDAAEREQSLCDAAEKQGQEGDKGGCHAMSRDVTTEKSREEEIPPIPPKGAKPPAVGLKSWMQGIKAKGEKPIPDGDEVFTYAAEVGIPLEFLHLAWLEFKHRYGQPDAKRYRNWRLVFRKAVRGNWLKLWYVSSGEYALTTVGIQAQRAHQEKAA